MTKRGWLVFAVIICAMFIGLIFFGGDSPTKIEIPKDKLDSIQEPGESNGNIGDHVYGKADSPVIIIEYADFQCPGCGQMAQLVKPVKELYKDKIAFVFRNFPLTSIHPNAIASSSAAEAAGLQGKYWEAHELLFSEQEIWSNLTGTARNEYFFSLATKLDLDKEKFKSDMASKAVKSKINQDTLYAKAHNITQTPSFLLDGTFINFSDDNTMAEAMKVLTDAIDSRLKKNGIELPTKN